MTSADPSASLEARVMRALDGAGDLTGDALLSHLRRAHADDPALLQELEALLDGQAPRVPVLDTTLQWNPATIARLRTIISNAARQGLGRATGLGVDAESDQGVGSVIGRYSVVRELGRGGMGVVYECEQQEPKRRVAVKVLRVGLGSSGVLLADAKREAQVLAQLSHPGIAHVIESGVDPHSGRAFFAMELVEGLPLLRHAASAGLSNRERIELLARVCDAVDHAHRRGVIHRDLKPSNVMVSACEAPAQGPGQPRVLDFGVAKLQDVRAGDTLNLPGVSSIIGTLGYISPEALAGDSHIVGTQADVYALGVMLYELLAGHPPIDLTDVPLSEVARRVQEERVTPLRRFDASLKGDMEAIVSKAMALQPELRYGTAGALGDDLRRWLRREPVVAQPTSAWYLVRTFMARHRVVSALAASLVVALLGGLVTSLVLFARAEKARAAEQTQREIAGAIRGYLVQDLIGAAQPGRGGHEARIVDVLRDLGTQVGSRFPESPELEGRVRHELAAAFHGLGMYDEGLAQGKESGRLLDQTAGPSDPTAIAARTMVAMCYASKGEAGLGEPFAQEAVARARRTLAITDPVRLRADAALGAVLHAQRRASEAEQVLSEVIRRMPEAPGLLLDDRTTMRIQYAAVLMQLDPPRVDEATGQLRSVLEEVQATHGASHPSALAARNNLVNVLIGARQFDDAMELAKDLPELTAKGLPPDHPAQGFAALTLARVCLSLKRYDEGYSWALQAVEQLRTSLGDSSWQYARSVAIARDLAGRGAASQAAPDWCEELVLTRWRAATVDEAPTALKVVQEQAKFLQTGDTALLRLLLDKHQGGTLGGARGLGDEARRVRLFAHFASVCHQLGQVDAAVQLLAHARGLTREPARQPGQPLAISPEDLAVLDMVCAAIDPAKEKRRE